MYNVQTENKLEPAFDRTGSVVAFLEALLRITKPFRALGVSMLKSTLIKTRLNLRMSFKCTYRDKRNSLLSRVPSPRTM